VEKLKFLHDFSAAKSSGISNGRVLLILNCSLPPRQFLLYYDHKIEYSKVFQHIPQQFELLLLFSLAFEGKQTLSCSRSALQLTHHLHYVAGMARGKQVSEDLAWTVIRLLPLFSVDEVSAFTRLSTQKIQAIIALHDSTGEPIKCSLGKKRGQK
jgi:hypothetical protein